MSLVTKCDACGKTEQQPIGWWQLEAFGVVSVNALPLPEMRQFCSFDCVATWAEAQVLADKKRTYREFVA